MIMSEQHLCYLSAAEALARFADRSLSPIELMRALIARSEAVEGRINAFTETWFDEALDAARRAEARFAAGNARPLEGIPLAVKEVEINGRIHRVSEEYRSATFPFNMLSRCPVLSLPSGGAANGVPTGVQCVARSFDDRRVFDAALAYERVFEPPWRLDPRFHAGE